MFNNATPFTMPVEPAYGRGGDGMFGGDGLWGLIIILALLGGFGNGGLGFGNNGGGVGAEVQRGFDTSNIVGKLDRLGDGIASLGYDQLAQINGIQQTLCQGFNGLNTGMLTGFNAIQGQMAECCCTTQRAIDGVNYNMATQACAIQHGMSDNTRDIIQTINNKVDGLEKLWTQDKIATLQAENQNLRLAASQANQNALLQAAMDAHTAEIIRRTGNDCPVPAYVVQPPTQVTFPVNACGQFGYNGCGCV